MHLVYNTQLASLQLKFTNINETGYSYIFRCNNINLRNGTYKIEALGLDNFPVEQTLTSNLIINNGATSKTILFNQLPNGLLMTKHLAVLLQFITKVCN
jgi:exo-poly-alpha-galacturonosidase